MLDAPRWRSTRAAANMVDPVASPSSTAITVRPRTSAATAAKKEGNPTDSLGTRLQRLDPHRRLNDALIDAERAFTDDRGLRGRPWYRHEIYAPGIFTGYAAQPLTDFQQALDDRNTTNAKEGLDRIISAIKRATDVLKKGSE